jgi:hypothetical protein
MHFCHPNMRAENKLRLICHTHDCLHNFCINCKCEQITQVDNTKYLGLIVDQDFSWKLHIRHISNKLRKIIRDFNFLKSNLTYPVHRIMYFSLAHSYFNHGITAWGSASPPTPPLNSGEEIPVLSPEATKNLAEGPILHSIDLSYPALSSDEAQAKDQVVDDGALDIDITEYFERLSAPAVQTGGSGAPVANQQLEGRSLRPNPCLSDFFKELGARSTLVSPLKIKITPHKAPPLTPLSPPKNNNTGTIPKIPKAPKAHKERRKSLIPTPVSSPITLPVSPASMPFVNSRSRGSSGNSLSSHRTPPI